jgi:hypothetical protein
MTVNKNLHERLLRNGDLARFQFNLNRIYANNASTRKQLNIQDQGMDRFNKFWRIRSGTNLNELSKKDQETHNKILGLIHRANIQLVYSAEERVLLNKEMTNFLADNE